MGKLKKKMLERYYDGDLSPKKAQKIEALLHESSEDQAQLQAISQISNLLRLMNEEELGDVSFEGFGDRVVRDIRRREKPPLVERLRVWAAEFFEHRPVIWVPSAVAITVALLAVIVIPWTTHPPVTPGHPGVGGEIQTFATRAPAASSEIAWVDFGGNTGNVYHLQNSGGGTTAVVWIEDTN